MTTLSGQNRSTLEEEGLVLFARLNNFNVVLRDNAGKYALYTLNDHYSGHVVVIDELGYEFVSSNVDEDGNPRCF